eukprot:364786-Chlamydomonas_euryale.AAC.20
MAGALWLRNVSHGFPGHGLAASSFLSRSSHDTGLPCSCSALTSTHGAWTCEFMGKLVGVACKCAFPMPSAGSLPSPHHIDALCCPELYSSAACNGTIGLVCGRGCTMHSI